MRLQTNVALIISAVVVALGVFLVLSRAGSDIAVFGYFLAVIGVLFGMVNLLLRTRM
jgi:hypothetical protein